MALGVMPVLDQPRKAWLWRFAPLRCKDCGALISLILPPHWLGYCDHCLARLEKQSSLRRLEHGG